ncbi:MAG: HipA N-terminal domain-containing protein [Verrucomicrobia bacterium]|nr:HipA N-terminal domain-containing protein [Verrucomicrobiota bacterium]
MTPGAKSSSRRARILVHGLPAATLEELEGRRYRLTYDEGYRGPDIARTLPLATRVWELVSFPSFFEGLLPEGDMFESLLRLHKLDRSDLFGQLLAVGRDVVGAVTVEELTA